MNQRTLEVALCGTRRLAFALACMAFAQPAAALAGGVYVASQGTSVEQAFGQALAENPARSKEPFWVVVAGADVARLSRKGAGPDSREWARRVLERGGMVYVCRTDMMRYGLTEEDLLDGVVAVYGYGAEEWAGLLPAKKDGVILPENIKQSQLILRTCAGNGKPA